MASEIEKVDLSAATAPLSPDAEIALLKAEIERLKKKSIQDEADVELLFHENALLKSRAETAEAETDKALAANPAAPVDGNPKQKYLVNIVNGPSWIVEATHPLFAEDAFKAATGLRSSAERPQISEYNGPLPVGRFIDR
jgi:hypothetical protein